MNRLRAFPLVYLATPYTRYSAGIHMAFVEASRIAAALLVQGVKVYSPIAHTHPLALYGNLDPLDHAIWLPFDQAMMDAACAVVVATMDGWRESYGVRHEVEYFHAAGKPIFYVNPETLRIAQSEETITNVTITNHPEASILVGAGEIKT